MSNKDKQLVIKTMEKAHEYEYLVNDLNFYYNNKIITEEEKDKMRLDFLKNLDDDILLKFFPHPLIC